MFIRLLSLFVLFCLKAYLGLSCFLKKKNVFRAFRVFWCGFRGWAAVEPNVFPRFLVPRSLFFRMWCHFWELGVGQMCAMFFGCGTICLGAGLQGIQQELDMFGVPPWTHTYLL